MDKILLVTGSRLYYDPARPSGFSTLQILQVAMRKKGKSADIRACLEKEEAYALHRPVRKRFARNRYNVTNVMDVWECDFLDVQPCAKYTDNQRYILSLIDVSFNFYT